MFNMWGYHSCNFLSKNSWIIFLKIPLSGPNHKVTVFWRQPPLAMNSTTSICHSIPRLRSGGGIIGDTSRLYFAKGFRGPDFSFYPCPFLDIPVRPLIAFAKKKKTLPEPILEPPVVEEVFSGDEEEEDGIKDDIFLEGFDDDSEFLDDGDDDDDESFEDEYFEEEVETSLGDGAGGGGISLSGSQWDKKVLDIAEEVVDSFNGELGIYAFKTLLNATVQVRIERLTNKSGSPNMTDIESFSTIYRKRLDEAEATGSIPSLSLEVSSPGVERVVRIPEDLERFKDRNLFVKYITDSSNSDSSSEQDGVFRLISFDPAAEFCTWGLADVRVNREKSGKGRPLNKKQREWRLNTPLDSLLLVRLYSEI